MCNICPTDVGNLRWVGAAVAAAVGIATSSPITALVVGIAINTAISWFQNADGSLDFYIPGDTLVRKYGWVYYYRARDWWYHYSEGSSWYCYALRYGTQRLWRNCY